MNIITKPDGANFHSSGLRQKVDRLMDILYAGGVNNPMDSIEQISYLLFLRLLSEHDELLASLERLHELPGLSPTGRLLFNRATLKIYDRPTLRAVVQAVHGLDLDAH